MRNAKTNTDWVNAKTGEVLAEAGTKITARTLRKWGEEGIKSILRRRRGADRPLFGARHGQ